MDSACRAGRRCFGSAGFVVCITYIQIQCIDIYKYIHIHISVSNDEEIIRGRACETHALDPSRHEGNQTVGDGVGVSGGHGRIVAPATTDRHHRQNLFRVLGMTSNGSVNQSMLRRVGGMRVCSCHSAVEYCNNLGR